VVFYANSDAHRVCPRFDETLIPVEWVAAKRTRERTRLGAEDLLVTTSYPVLRGQTDATFEFSLEVNNRSDSDRTVNLAAQAPEKWEVNFKPGYEQKQISSLRIRGGAARLWPSR